MTEHVTQLERVVTLTEPAARQVQQLLASDSANAGKTLRVFVEGGGCSGLQYGLVFDSRQADDTASESFGVSVLVDPRSVDHLRGAVIDFKDELNDSGFKISNPNAQKSCGCGKSFEGCC